MKPCTLGKRHKWAFAHNVITQIQSGRSVRVSSRGNYRCEGGTTKLGEPGV